MGKTDPSADRHRQAVHDPGPARHPWGNHRPRHGDLRLRRPQPRRPRGDRVQRRPGGRGRTLIGGVGEGFAIAQARLGPGRIHHCMRSIGLAERAIELMCAQSGLAGRLREAARRAGVIRDWIAEARVRIEQLRLLVLKAAWLRTRSATRRPTRRSRPSRSPRRRRVEWILDKAIQVHGAGGLSQDFPLASAFAGIRTLRFADGPERGTQERPCPRRTSPPSAPGAGRPGAQRSGSTPKGPKRYSDLSLAARGADVFNGVAGGVATGSTEFTCVASAASRARNAALVLAGRGRRGCAARLG